MASDHIKSDIPAYLNGDLSDGRRREFEAHVAGCEACRSTLQKAKAKSARSKRQSLKSAVPDRVPNLLLNRLGRQAGIKPQSARRSGLWFVVLLLFIGAGYLVMHLQNRRPADIGTPSQGLTDTASSETPSEPYSVAGSSPSPVVPPALPPPVSTSAATIVPEAPRQWAGGDSLIKEFREVVIRGRAPWRALWTEMGQEGVAPRIDFNQMMLVGIFAGEKPMSGYEVLLEPMRDAGDHFVIPYRVLPPPPSHGLPGVTHPYKLMTLPRVPKRVQFSEQPS